MEATLRHRYPPEVFPDLMPVAPGPIEVQVSHSVDPDAWNRMVAAHPFGRFEDTTLRHQAFCRCHPDTRRFYLTARIGEREVGYLGFCETFFGHDILTWKKAWRPLIFPFAYAMSSFDAFTAPLIFAEQREADITKAFLETLDRLAKDRHIYLLTHLRYPSPGHQPALGPEYFAQRDFRCLAHGTYLIDLRQDLDALWAGLKQEARTAVRKARKQGIEVRLGEGEEDFARYYELFAENRLRDQHKGMLRPVYSAESMVDHVRFFASRDALKLFCAHIDGQLGSATLVKYYNGIVSFNCHARGDEWHGRNLHDGDLLVWEMIRWAREQGFRYFDMTGFDVVPANERQRGIQRFKSKWGGECVYYNYYSKVYGRARDRAVSLARKALR